MRSRKRQITERIEQPEEVNLQVIGNIGSGHHQTSANERKNKKEYFRQMRKLLKTKL